MRIWLGCVLALVATDVAAAPPKRKAASAKYPLEALRQFTEGVLNEELGQFQRAVEHYRSSLHASPQASTHFNLARLYLELGDIVEARKSFEAYLAMLPDAPDAAAVTGLIKQLASRTELTIGSSSSSDAVDAFILVDGEPVGRSPAMVHPPAGEHWIERISPTGWGGEKFEVKAGTAQYRDLFTSRPATGNVVISHSALINPLVFADRATELAIFQPFKLPAGKLKTKLPIESESRLCTAIEIDVKSTAELTYVRVDVGERTQPDDSTHRCYPVLKVRTHRFPLRAP